MDIHKHVIITFDKHAPLKTFATVTVDKAYIEAVYHEAVLKHQKTAHTYGFAHGTTPLPYIQQTYKIPITEHIQEFFFSSCVVNFLSHELIKSKMVIAGDPQLIDICIDLEKSACFKFELIITPLTVQHDWKKLFFKAPARKNYRDIDKQVESFLKEEAGRTHKVDVKTAIQTHDWICFSIHPLKADKSDLLPEFQEQIWLRIGDEEADQEAQDLFIGKRQGETFITDARFLQEYISNNFDSPYSFLLKIIDHLPHDIFSVDSFKKHFRLKSVKDLHLKLIEVFSFRNDLSQRRETVEAVLKMLLKNYPLSVSEALVRQQQERVLAKVHLNPDYYVYKAQKDFKEKIRQLAEKQLKETILIDSIAYAENIQVTHEDILGYINLLKRPRTKEFIYFDLPPTRLQDKETPLPYEVVLQHCLREKTLNYIIYCLTKK